MEEKKMGRQLFFAAAIILYGIFLGMPVWGQSRLQRGIAREVLRFHVLADSDSTEDQILKMQVKDVLVEKLNGLLQDCENAAESEKAVQENLGQIENLGCGGDPKEGIFLSGERRFGKCLVSGEVLRGLYFSRRRIPGASGEDRGGKRAELVVPAFPRTLFCRDCGGRGAAAAERKAPSGPHTGGIRGSHRKGKSAFRI